MQDPRIQSLSLPRQMHPGVPPGAVTEEYLRALHPFATSDDLHLISVPMGLDTAAAHAAATYYHPAYLLHPLSLQSRMEKSLCLSALRAPFYSVPGGGALPSRHPSALHLHLPGSRYSAEFSHTALAERLQMESELHKQEWEHEHDREKEEERGAKAMERETEEEVDRQKERHRGRQQQMVREAERHYLAELQTLRAQPEDRPWLGERLTLNRPDKAKESEHLGFTAPKPLSLHSSRGSVPHPVPSLVPSHVGKHHGALAAAMMTQRMRDDVWLTGHGMQDRKLDLCSSRKGAEPWRENHRSNPVNSHSKGPLPSLGVPPPLISPKGPPNPSIPATTLWNPASFVDSTPACRVTPSTLPNRPPPKLTRSERPPLGWGERTEDSRRRVEKLERYHSSRGANLQDIVSKSNTEQDRTLHNLYQWKHIGPLQQRGAPFSTSLSADVEVWEHRSSPSLARERPSHAPEPLLMYDETLQQHRRLLSKLDLKEKEKREAMEEGYYYDMESCNGSDEEEVKAHLRRVTEQPPLKLDTCSEKVEFLSLCGLTTCSQRDKLLCQKRKKRRRMLRERSPSPPAAQVKKSCPLTTPYSAEQMDRTPELGQKKDFLSIFNLGHVSSVERREKQKTKELTSIKKNGVILDTLRCNLISPCSSPSPPPLNGDSRSLSLSNGHSFPDSPSPSPPFLHKPKNALYNDTVKSTLDPLEERIPTPKASHLEKTQFMKQNGKFYILQNGTAVSPMKQTQSGQNGHSCPWEKSTPEVFAQHFHQTVLQSTPSKDVHLNSDPSLPSNASSLKDVPPLRSQCVNSHQLSTHEPSWDIPLAQEPLSDEDVQSGQDEGNEEGEEAAPRRWQGIESVFEAYNQYAEEHTIERQVLQSHCKRLEAQNHILTRTAKQLSQTMGELMSQRQRVCEENKRLQAQLEYIKRCLTLPNLQWSRGQVNGHTPRIMHTNAVDSDSHDLQRRI